MDGLLRVGEFLRYFQENGGRLHAWHLYRFMPVGRGGSLNSERFETADGAFEAFGEVLKARFEGTSRSIFGRICTIRKKRPSIGGRTAA